LPLLKFQPSYNKTYHSMKQFLTATLLPEKKLRCPKWGGVSVS